MNAMVRVDEKVMEGARLCHDEAVLWNRTRSLLLDAEKGVRGSEGDLARPVGNLQEFGTTMDYD